ncbi:MAG: nuclear transport factor 2 family protein [Ignavibacteria bacterium]
MSTNSNSPQQVVQQFLKSLAERNSYELLQLFSENTDWYIPGDKERAPWLGRRNSREEIRTFYELLWKNTQPVSAQIDHTLTDKDTAIITGEFKTKMLQTNKIVESPFCIQMTVENGLITRYLILEDSYAVSEPMKSPD